MQKSVVLVLFLLSHDILACVGGSVTTLDHIQEREDGSSVIKFKETDRISQRECSAEWIDDDGILMMSLLYLQFVNTVSDKSTDTYVFDYRRQHNFEGALNKFKDYIDKKLDKKEGALLSFQFNKHKELQSEYDEALKDYQELSTIYHKKSGGEGSYYTEEDLDKMGEKLKELSMKHQYSFKKTNCGVGNIEGMSHFAGFIPDHKWNLNPRSIPRGACGSFVWYSNSASSPEQEQSQAGVRGL